MKRDFTHEDFDDFLKQSADSLRMKAPDRVWQNVSKTLHKRRRRFIAGLSAFLLITSATGYYITHHISEDVDTSAQHPIQQQVINHNSRIEKAKNPQTNSTQQPGNDIANSINNVEPVAVGSAIGMNNTANIPTNDPAVHQDPNTSIAINSFEPTTVDSYTEFDEKPTDNKLQTKQADLNNMAALPLTIESVTNLYKASTSKIKKFEAQLYFTPTVSYRKLTENKSYLRTLDPANIPANLPALHSSVNNNVTHKPDVGFEVGFAVKYPLSHKLKLRTGLQFNVNRYDVKAFNSPLSNTIIALNNGSSVDSLNAISGYSNVQRFGSKSNWLQNLSFQLSIPVGTEYIFSDNGKVQFGVAATVQPTYVLGDRAYLISTDYKSYTQVPGLIRRWNVNTAFETFVSLHSGKANWQIGPQVRYQLLSSFISKYPVKENLFDFGLKVGVSLNK